jgi:hypothetical protein
MTARHGQNGVTSTPNQNDKLLLLPQVDSYQFTGTELVWSLRLGLRDRVRMDWKLRFLNLDL